MMDLSLIHIFAEQSDQSSQEIEQIASTLIRDSSLAVESMQSMQQIMRSAAYMQKNQVLKLH